MFPCRSGVGLTGSASFSFIIFLSKKFYLILNYISTYYKECIKKIIETEENNENETGWNCFEMAAKGH